MKAWMVDTSALIDFLRANGSLADLSLQAAMLAQDVLLVPPVVIQEVLQGARSGHHMALLEEQLWELQVFESDDWRDTHTLAAQLYARCRWRGRTPRSSNDCLIAACAIQANVPLIANDRDFEELMHVEPRLRLG